MGKIEDATSYEEYNPLVIEPEGGWINGFEKIFVTHSDRQKGE